MKGKLRFYICSGCGGLGVHEFMSPEQQLGGRATNCAYCGSFDVDWIELLDAVEAIRRLATAIEQLAEYEERDR